MIIHYDLKPGNVLFDEFGIAKVIDFGLSKIMEDDVWTTRHGTDIPRYRNLLVAIIPNYSILATVGQKMASTLGVSATLFDAQAKDFQLECT